MYKVIGTRMASFTAKDQTQIEGINLYCAYEDKRITGCGCERFFVTPKKFINGVVPRVDDLINVNYNRYGKVDSVEVVPG